MGFAARAACRGKKPVPPACQRVVQAQAPTASIVFYTGGGSTKRGGVFIRTLLAAILFAATSASAQTAAQCESIVNVGSWNIQWLGNAKAGKRKPQYPNDVAAYIAAGKVDVLGLAEISATGKVSGQARNQTLVNILNASGAKWRYVLFEKRSGARAPEDQWTGIAWNETVVSLAGGPWKLDVAVDAKREDEIRVTCVMG